MNKKIILTFSELLKSISVKVLNNYGQLSKISVVTIDPKLSFDMVDAKTLAGASLMSDANAKKLFKVDFVNVIDKKNSHLNLLLGKTLTLDVIPEKNQEFFKSELTSTRFRVQAKLVNSQVSLNGEIFVSITPVGKRWLTDIFEISSDQVLNDLYGESTKYSISTLEELKESLK